ncbi:isopentenyl-diphosphate Delta-isomerase [Longimicrobium sp.]|uniref:isopentenyl-diphosphate Delta-isomerase n=1 Tax=Longimicrobium sp. TaxID=2029185 RepID=UPI002EDB9463
MSEERVILVDGDDVECGTAEKLAAHAEGALHRAFSVVVFNRAGEMLLQCRAAGKYHSAGLWSNACCGHPRPGEDVRKAARRRLAEEMGIDCKLKPLFHLRYHADVGGGLVENEYDHVFTALYDGDEPRPNPAEVQAWRWVPLEEIRRDVDEEPERYTAWFPLLVDELAAEGARY